MADIERLTEVTEDALSDFNKLIRQLRTNHPNAGGATLDELQAIIDNKDVILIVAKDGAKIVGMATLYILQKLAKRTGCVEDVVVDEAYRGQGLGEKMMQMLIQKARDANVSSLFLTSRPERAAANKLYQKLGFEQKQTNPYTMKL